VRESAPELAVGDAIQSDRILLGDQILDGAIFDFFEL